MTIESILTKAWTITQWTYWNSDNMRAIKASYYILENLAHELRIRGIDR